MITPEQLAKSGTESAHQQALFAWAALYAKAYPSLNLLHAIPNGGKRDKVTAGRMKAEGARAGVWDIFLPVPMHNYHGLYIEMKVGSNTITREQKWFREQVEFQGFHTYVCYSWKEAAGVLVHYLRMDLDVD